MSNKCDKCGAEIPDNASFCPGCGAPNQPEQPSVFEKQEPVPEQPAKQTYQAPPPPVPKPKKPAGQGLKNLADTLFSKMIIMLAICLGFLLAWIGKILTIFTDFGTTSYDAGTVLLFTGLSGMGFVMLGGALLNKKFDKYIRLGMLVSGGLIIVLALTLTAMYSAPDFSSMFSGIPGF